MQILTAREECRTEITSLLQSQKLPSEDLPVSLAFFYTAIEEDKIVGLIGMEHFGHNGLLRSLVVHPNYRNMRIAETLVVFLEEQAVASGVSDLFLLTETADEYFRRKGYQAIDRNEVPNEVKQSSEFSHVCPVSAIVMKKQLQTGSVLDQ